MKSVLVLLDGREQVMGFHFAGEMLGADAIAGGKHPTSAVALEDCTVCALPAHVDGPEGPAIRSRFWSAIAMAALREREVASLLASSGAEQRVAGFLVDIAARLDGHEGPGQDFRLPMSRAEIASLLGLSVETVSRSFTALAQQGFIDVRRKRIHIADPGRLGAHAPPPALGWMRAATMHEEASA